MIIRDFTFHSQSTDSEIYRISARSEEGKSESRGIVLALHGLGDHIRSHEKAFSIFCDMGYRVEGFDWPGNGLSEGKRGDIPGVKPSLRLLWEVIESLDEKPVAIYAHSTGAFLVLHFLLRYRSRLPIEWIWLSSPLIRPTHRQAKIKQWASRVIAKWFPKLTILTGVRPSRCYHVNDSEAIPVATEFEHRHSKISARFGQDLLMWEPRIRNAARALRDPVRVLITQGGEDVVCPPHYASEFFDEINASDKTFLSLPTFRHEPLHEPDNEEFVRKVRRWIEANSAIKAN